MSLAVPVRDDLLDRHHAIDAFLRGQEEITLATDAEYVFKKAFVIACGTYCEVQITDVIGTFADRAKDERLTWFVKRRALERRYHDMFDWTGTNANKFFAAFGERFKDECVQGVKADKDLDQAIRSFLQMGALRNGVAHVFFSTNIDKTVSELEELMKEALRFIEFIEGKLAEVGI